MKLPPHLLKSQNDIASLLTMLYTPDGLQAFGEMAEDKVNIAWAEVTPEEAHAILLLLTAGIQMQKLIEQASDIITFVPPVVLKGLANMYRQLWPYHSLLMDIEARRASGLEAKIRAGEISIANGQGVSMSVEQLNSLLLNAA